MNALRLPRKLINNCVKDVFYFKLFFAWLATVYNYVDE